jgi:hypothetical protein
MAKLKKLFEKIVNNPNDVGFDDLDKLLKRYGFTRRHPRKGSSHFTYHHSQLDEILTIPKDRPIKAIYVKKAIGAIRKLQDRGEVE